MVLELWALARGSQQQMVYVYVRGVCSRGCFHAGKHVSLHPEHDGKPELESRDKNQRQRIFGRI